MKRIVIVILLACMTSLCFGSVVVHKTTFEVRRSVHTPLYVGNSNWVILDTQAKINALPKVSKIYWKEDNGKILEMTAVEKTVKDNTLLIAATLVLTESDKPDTGIGELI